LSSLLDLPFPLLDALDAALGFVLPAPARVVLWGLLAGVLAMALYALASDQGRIRSQKAVIRRVQGELKAAGDDFAATMRLTRANLKASLKLLGMVTGPAVLSSLPLLFLLVWVAETYAYAPPAAGAPVPVAFVPTGAGLSVSPAGALNGSTVTWPAAGALEVRDAQGPVWAAPATGPRPPTVVHKRSWWSWLYGNPAGYLRPDTGLEEIRFAQAPRELLGLGPGWLRGWEAVFFTSLVAASLTTKRLAKID
jgi:hypothetical protein